MIWFIIHGVILYCKNSGRPYKNSDLQKKTNHIGLIFLIWTGAFVLKILIGKVYLKITLK